VTAYDVFTVPETGDQESSRYQLGVSPGGWSSPPGSTVSLAYNHLTEALVAATPPLTPEQKTVALKRCVRTADGYVLLDRGSVTASVERVTSRNGRFSACKSKGGALLDEFLRGEAAWTNARDEAIFDALRDLCEAVGATGEEARALSDTIARAVLLRAGILKPPNELPLNPS
jgi:hypothetical protein